MSITYKISILPMIKTVTDERTGETLSSEQDDWYIFPDEVRESLTPILSRHGYTQTLGAFPMMQGEKPVSDSRNETALLVERCLAGDREAFGEIYNKFAPLVHGILLSRLPRDEVSDAVQDVFLAAYKNLGSLREPNALGGWLARIARNHVVDHYRGSRPSEELPEHIEGKKDQRLEAEEALAAIQSLPIAYRETLILRLVEGMTGNEIAEQTGLSPDSVRVNLHRGMNLLRKKLGIGGEK